MKNKDFCNKNFQEEKEAIYMKISIIKTKICKCNNIEYIHNYSCKWLKYAENAKLFDPNWISTFNPHPAWNETNIQVRRKNTCGPSKF